MVRCDSVEAASAHASSSWKMVIWMVSNGMSRARVCAYPWYSPATPRCLTMPRSACSGVVYMRSPHAVRVLRRTVRKPSPTPTRSPSDELATSARVSARGCRYRRTFTYCLTTSTGTRLARHEARLDRVEREQDRRRKATASATKSRPMANRPAVRCPSLPPAAPRTSASISGQPVRTAAPAATSLVLGECQPEPARTGLGTFSSQRQMAADEPSLSTGSRRGGSSCSEVNP